MRALLVLYLITAAERGGLGWSVEQASRLYGWYTGLVYLTPVIGGYLADRYLGTHHAIVIGSLLIAFGHFSLAFESPGTFYLGLLLVIVGTGFFKSNISTMVGQLYDRQGGQRDAGFTIFYMGINLGALIGPLVCGYLAQSSRFGWGYGFGAAGVGMVAGLILYLAGRRRFLGDIGRAPAVLPRGLRTGRAALSREERERITALLLLSFFVMFFWLAFEQAGSSMTVFAERSTDRTMPVWLGTWLPERVVPTAWFQSINPAFILLLAPFFSLFWVRLGARGLEPSTAVKMALGLILLGGGFVFLVLGAVQSDAGRLVSPGWLIAAYFLHTCGELCLSPVGLAMVTRVAPLRFASMLMGVWFLANFAANLAAGYLAGMFDTIKQGDVIGLFGGQADFFLLLVVSSIGVGMVLLMVGPWLGRLMHERS
jgi:POT family proton-dependent oligopeptide transporter